MANFSDIRLMGVSGGSSELNSSTSTYKAEVERTEALQAYFNQQIINIFNELAKDDSISKSNKISQIVAGLQDIKRARKRWASGTNGSFQRFRELNLNFTPRNGFVYLICDADPYETRIMSLFLNGDIHTFCLDTYHRRVEGISVFSGTGIDFSDRYDPYIKFPVTYDDLNNLHLLSKDLMGRSLVVDVKAWYVTD